MAPRKWLDNPREWLTSNDIDAVMAQYEQHYPHFAFLGASPIDFDARPTDSKDKCVWKKLCDLDIAKELDAGKTQLAAILNADPHYKDGSHWMTIYINLNAGYVLYFDSTGDPMPKEVRKLVARLKTQGSAIGLKLRVIVNRARHQRQDTECGVYGLFVIAQLLEGQRTPSSLVRGRISDNEMYAFRRHFFNIPEAA